MASAGIDESNGNGKIILLPKDSFKIAETLRKKLRTKYEIKDLGILIVDSRCTLLRAGVAGVGLGWAGLKGIRDYKEKKDIFGRKFKFSRTNIVDNLASASVLVMGEGNEKQPLAIIKNAPIEFLNKVDPKELDIAVKDDIHEPLFKNIIP